MLLSATSPYRLRLQSSLDFDESCTVVWNPKSKLDYLYFFLVRDCFHCHDCQLSDLFREAWNLRTTIIVYGKCCDIMSMNCDIKNSEVLNILDVENSS